MNNSVTPTTISSSHARYEDTTRSSGQTQIKIFVRAVVFIGMNLIKTVDSDSASGG